MSLKIADFLDLNSIKIRIKNLDNVEKKLIKLIEGGKNKLQVVMDFDETLTKQKLENGNRVISTGEIVAECPSIRSDYKEKYWKIYQFYRPKEIDPNISIEEKRKMMDERYRLVNNLLVDFKMPMDELDALAKIVSDNFRNGVDIFLNKLNMENIPLLLFSAGSGDAIIQILNHKNYYTPNIKIVSNFLEFDDNGVVIGAKGNLIHMFNKNQSAILGTDIHDFIKTRTNVLLVGDSLGDSNMSDGMDNIDTVLKIGFLQHNLEENLPVYLDAFDIVLIDDQSVDVLINILKYI